MSEIYDNNIDNKIEIMTKITMLKQYFQDYNLDNFELSLDMSVEELSSTYQSMIKTIQEYTLCDQYKLKLLNFYIVTSLFLNYNMPSLNYIF